MKLYKTKLNNFRYRARLYSEILAKIHKKHHLGLLTETHEVVLRPAGLGPSPDLKPFAKKGLSLQA